MAAMAHRTFSGNLKITAGWLMVLVILLGLAGCSPAAASIPTSTLEPAAVPTDTSVVLPSPTLTATSEPTATAAPSATTAPTATATLPPAATLVPDLAVLPDGFTAWCAPQEYQGVSLTNPDAPAYANVLADKAGDLRVKIPAAFCVMAYTFNQPVPEGTNLVFYNANSPFLNLPLTPVEGRPEQAWAVLGHDYVINPPFWEITYRAAVTNPDGDEIWSQPVTFAKPLPAPCPFGGLPDPVTLYCRQSDPKELEPHPDVTFPAYYTRVPSDD